MNVRAGSLKEFLSKWKSITTDTEVLDAVKGYRLPIISSVPTQTLEPRSKEFTDIEISQTKVCIDRMLDIGAIKIVNNVEGQFLSSIFIVPKPDGSGRFILNLKQLNNYLFNSHFKMEDYRTVLQLLRNLDFMAKVDLKDAYYLIAIDDRDKKYLRFRFKSQLYEFQCMPFGLCTAPRIFTKLMKPVLGILRSQGHRVVGYLDDLLMLGNTDLAVQAAVRDSRVLLDYLGLVVNVTKSEFIPKQRIEYLGFCFDSVQMSVSLPQRKITSVSNSIQEILNKSSVTIQSLSEVLGKLIAATPAVPYSVLYTKQLELEKTNALLRSGGFYSGKISLSSVAKEDMKWWLNNIGKKHCKILGDTYDYCVTTDASPSGWGAEFDGAVTRGFWTTAQQLLHINTLELFAVELTLQTFCSEFSNVNILVRTDSTTGIAYINKKGGCRSRVNHIFAKRIWKWCEEREINIRATYINTKANYIADAASREEVDDTDFSLDMDAYNIIIAELGCPEVDLFASYNTTKCKKFYSWFPDPSSAGVDAFTQNWSEFFYAFPPFSLISRVLNKVANSKSKGIIVVPNWKCQPWFPVFKSMIVSKTLFLDNGTFDLMFPYENRSHSLPKNLALLAAVISG